MLKPSAFGLGIQHLPREQANINAWKAYLILILKRNNKKQIKISS